MRGMCGALVRASVGKKMTVTFANQLGIEVHVSWVDFDGSERPSGKYNERSAMRRENRYIIRPEVKTIAATTCAELAVFAVLRLIS